MSSVLSGLRAGMGSTNDRNRRLLAIVASIALLVAALSVAALGGSPPNQSGAATLVSAPAAAAPAAAAPVASAPDATTAAAPLQAAKKSVMIMNYKYSPATLTVNVGDTVTWTNMDTAPHTVTVTSGPVSFDSGTLQKGESFTYTFKEVGTYEYYCAVHPDMVASVKVVGSVSEPTPDPSPDPSPDPTEDPEPTEDPDPTEDPMGHDPKPTTNDACVGLNAAVDTFMQHVYAAHLETSLFQQVRDALSLDKYVLAHTVLIKNMVERLLGGTGTAVNVFMQHVYAAHLETSLSQQVKDAIDIDAYAKAHTVMIANMLKPLLGSDLSSC